ncbi:MAG: acyl-CoA/acyl-ACP dehydrogenase [Pirellulales bacterium]|nr:acyl-CoA/acyl-ACP dehydrogenase [Pirellulales bacterium]
MIASPQDPMLAALCRLLRSHAAEVDSQGLWPAAQLAACAEQGVYRWGLPREHGGLAWSEADLVRGLLQLASCCLTTTFLLTQPAGCLRRLIDSPNHALRDRYLEPLASGKIFGAVGIAHLTTSRRHLARPMLVATRRPGGFTLQGQIPWVSGGSQAEVLVVGASCPDGQQLLLLVPTSSAGVCVEPPLRMVGLSATRTGPVRFDQVRLDDEWILAGPAPDLFAQRGRAGTGSIHTSALALGHARGALSLLESEASTRAELVPAWQALEAEYAQAEQNLLALAAGDTPCTPDALRAAANSLALRCAQALLAASKGSGYIEGHPAGRYCREALFFLVWSCPQPVVAAALCELAGL